MQNDMRNRLANLICEAEEKVNNEYPTIEMVADHLIANGVIVLPCKLGDKAYFIWNFYEPEIQECEVEEFRFKHNVMYICLSYVNCIGHYEHLLFSISDINKTVFLTKKEAEAKLKELNNEH